MSDPEREKRLAEKLEFAVDGIWLSHKNTFGLVTKEPASWQLISLWNECLRLMAQNEYIKATERLPEDGVPVLVCVVLRGRNGSCAEAVNKAVWLKNAGWSYDGTNPINNDLIVTHWREITLPEEKA